MTVEYMNGWSAHRNLKVYDDNPYNESTQAVSHAQWVTGWTDRYNSSDTIDKDTEVRNFMYSDN
jgi:hypothetical protein